jgi:hypothetical protein
MHRKQGRQKITAMSIAVENDNKLGGRLMRRK